MTPSDSMRLVVNSTSPLARHEQRGQRRPPAVGDPQAESVDHDDQHHPGRERQQPRRPERAQAQRVRDPQQGQEGGPWEEKTSRNGWPPARSAPAEAR